MSEPRERIAVGSRGRLARPGPTVAALALLGLVLALAAAGWVRQRNEGVAAERFETAASRLATRVQDRFALYEYGLRGARGVVAAIGEAGLTGAAFERYARSRDFDREFPGARGFGFIRRVPVRAEDAFLQAARAETRGFAIRQLAAHDGERFVIRYVEPLARNREAIGLDVASEPARRDAALRAMETGAAAMTGPVTLVQAPGEVERGFLAFLPVFAPDRPHATPDERRAATVGWSYAPLVIDEVLAGLDLDANDLDFAIEDRSPGQTQRFYATPGMSRPADALPATSRRLAVFDRDWAIALRARPAFVRDFSRPAPLVAGGVVLLLGLLGAGLTHLHLRGRRRDILAAVQSARLAAIVENAEDAILGKAQDGTITDWNPAAERLFGYPAAEAVGRKVVDLIVPPHLRAEEEQMLAAVARGEPVPSRATLRRRRDGTTVHVLLGVSPIRGPGGVIVGAATVMRDVGERIAHEARIQALNASLERQVAERTQALRAASAIRSAILEHAGYAIIATDPDGRITVFNPAAERMLGYAASEVVGRATPMLFHDEAQIGERARRLSAELGERIEPGPDTFLAPARQGRPTVDEWIYRTKDGRRLPVLLSVSEMRSEVGGRLGYLGIALDLSERDRHAAEMRAANAGTWSYDIATGRVRLSAECARQHGLPDAETDLDVAAGWRPLAHPDDAAQVLADLNAAIETGGSYTTEFRVPLADGRTRWLTAIGRVEPGHAAGTGRVIGLTLDVTARKEAEHALVEARREAERANRAKGEFLAAMSHEIRTPLNAILGYTGLMLDGGRLGPAERRQAELVRSAGAALLTVVNDILDISRIEAGAVTLSPHPFSPAALAAQCLALVAVLAEPKGLALRLETAPDLPEPLLGDEARLRQVLLNLLNNAVKFTQAGAVTLSIRRDDDPIEGGEGLSFGVRDTGIGIPRDKRDRLFKRFSQVDGSVEREYGGTGLGLAISKALVEMMGGEIGVESTPGVGSTFWFTLRLPRAAPVAAPPPAGRANDRAGRLLVVDDNFVNRELARTVLERAGHAVTVAGDGETAVRAVADGDVDLVLMDVQMPGMDGLSATRAIRALPGEAGEIPVIGMSAGVLPEQVRRCREAGMDEHVGKPFDPEALVALVGRWLPGDESGDAPTDAPGPGFDAARYDDMARRLGPERLDRVLRVLDDDLERAFTAAAGTPEGRRQIRFDAHAVGSAAGVMGFSAMTAACRILEEFEEVRLATEGMAAFETALERVRHLAAEIRTELRRRLHTEPA
ncbi:PAS domain S-box protein [Methylorubrum salsuginis]|uniref:histidine kinase n=1 Tax=Methylorubrum salsuginis TaxID=414703 RepID=A0A1I4HBN6_9HYPH|nr:PAS domain S-box protein [Methylorubrum salsuginis]SFL38841.1 PAS domain S-box-containing protein [Methylorubrum salsuginis]